MVHQTTQALHVWNCLVFFFHYPYKAMLNFSCSKYKTKYTLKANQNFLGHTLFVLFPHPLLPHLMEKIITFLLILLFSSCFWSYFDSSYVFFPCLYSIPVYTVKESTRPHEKLDSICTPPAKHRNADLLCSVGIHGLRMVKQCQLWFCRLFKASRSHPWGMRYCILWSWRQKCILDLAPINWTQCAFLCLADGERWAAWWEMLYGLGF